MSIDAGNAGKDVYIEKPLTYTIDKDKAIIRAAQLNDRVFQIGMQQRSGAHYMKAKAEYF
jgi:predicted dehydrogenase